MRGQVPRMQMSCGGNVKLSSSLKWCSGRAPRVAALSRRNYSTPSQSCHQRMSRGSTPSPRSPTRIPSTSTAATGVVRSDTRAMCVKVIVYLWLILYLNISQVLKLNRILLQSCFSAAYIWMCSVLSPRSKTAILSLSTWPSFDLPDSQPVISVTNVTPASMPLCEHITT